MLDFLSKMSINRVMKPTHQLDSFLLAKITLDALDFIVENFPVRRTIITRILVLWAELGKF